MLSTRSGDTVADILPKILRLMRIIYATNSSSLSCHGETIYRQEMRHGSPECWLTGKELHEHRQSIFD